MLNHRTTLVVTAILVAVISYGFYSGLIGFWWVAVPVLMYFGLVGRGSYNIESGFFIKAVCEVPNDKNQVAITFDDGPNAEFTPKVLEILDAHQAKATFFCIGTNVEAQPETLKMVHEKGHAIGNHSYSHTPKLDMSPTRKVKEDLLKCENAIESVIGKKPILFRPPFGVTNPKIAKAVNQLKLKTIGWNIRSLDTTNDAEDVVFERTKNIKAGDIVLLHDTSDKSVNVLKRLLTLLDEKGLKSVTINELTNTKAYAE